MHICVDKPSPVHSKSDHLFHVSRYKSKITPAEHDLLFLAAWVTHVADGKIALGDVILRI